MQIGTMTHTMNNSAPAPKTIVSHHDSLDSDEDRELPTAALRPSLTSASRVRRLPVTCPRRIEAGMLRQRASALPWRARRSPTARSSDHIVPASTYERRYSLRVFLSR